MARRTPAKPPAASRLKLDGWENALTGLGTATRDKRRGNQIVPLRITALEAEYLWRGDDIAAKIIEKPAREMVRRWIDVLVEGESEQARAIEARLDELGAKAKVRKALMSKRAFGGAGILLGADDGAIDLTKPLNEKNLKAIRWLTVLDAEELRPVRRYSSLGDAKYGEPSVYEVQPRDGRAPVGQRVHESRVLILQGIQVSRRHANERNGWGDSVFVRVFEVLSDCGMVWGSAATLLSDFSQAIFRIRGLAEAMASGREDLVRKRIEAIELGRSVVRAALLDAGDPEQGDAGEAFERVTTSLAGYPEMIEQFKTRMASAADMPVTQLWGDSPKGLSTGDKSGETWWNDHIAGLQEEELRDPINRLVKLLLLSREGPTKGKEPEKWSIRFRPLRQLTPNEEADRRLKNAQADKAYVDMQAVMPEEVAASRFGGDTYGEDLVIDQALRRKMAQTPDPRPEDAPPDKGAPPAKR